MSTDHGLHSASDRRSVVLCAIGAILGLLIAGEGLFSARGTRIAGIPAEDVATVNQVPILRIDFENNLESLYGTRSSGATAEQKRKVLDDMIREELYTQRGIELGLQNDVTEVRQATVAAVEAQQATDAVATQPTEQQLHDFYDAHRALYASEGTMLLTDYVAPSRQAGQAAVAAYRAGVPLASVLQRTGLRSSGRVDDGEEFYFAVRAHLGDALFAVARRLDDGQMSDPVVQQDGSHVLLMQHIRRPVVAPFDQVRVRVLADFRGDRETRIRTGADTFLRKRADIQVAEDLR